MGVLRAALLLLLVQLAFAAENARKHHARRHHHRHGGQHGMKLRGRHAAASEAQRAHFIRCAELLQYDPTSFKTGDLPDTVAESLADSETIETPEGVGDCGHVHTIIGKWGKSTKVGNLMGDASNAATAADKAAGNALSAKDKADEAASAASDVGGEEMEAVAGTATTASEGAQSAADAASSASADVSTQLETVKGQIGTMGGFDVDDADIQDLKEKVELTKVAAKDADKAAEYAIEKAEAAKKTMLGSIDGAMKMIETVVDKALDVVAKSKDVKQKAIWSANEATKIFDAAGEISTTLEGKIQANEGDQGPVFQSLQEGLDGEIDGGKVARSALCAEEGDACEDSSSIGEMDASMAEVEAKADELKTAMEAMSMDANPAGLGSIATEVKACEGLVEDLESKTGVVEMKAEMLTKRKKSVSKFAGKAAEYGIPWAPPPETPLGAPTGPMPDAA